MKNNNGLHGAKHDMTAACPQGKVYIKSKCVHNDE
jgi:hypothetical protein